MTLNTITNETSILSDKHILFCFTEATDLNALYKIELENIKNNFCGIQLSNVKQFNYINSLSSIIYLCGAIENNYHLLEFKENQTIYVVKELSENFEYNSGKYMVINIGRVPINIHNVGVYFRNVFDDTKDYFNDISNDHHFQTLTESNKVGNAFRKGLYMSKVEETNNVTSFNLLRCSTNLRGPTENFRNTDNEIIDTVNNLSKHFFSDGAMLNHVLAQIYENNIVCNNTKTVEKKAKIKEHSDKTKDMPRNGLIAFTTFYENTRLPVIMNSGNSSNLFNKKSSSDLFDYCYNDTSILTRLRFRLKESATHEFVRPTDKLEKQFDITLYPNSVFLIPLSTNRLYTHEILPSILSINKIPTRMGYVIRCSKTKAVFKDDMTFIEEDDNYIKLEPMTDDDSKKIKDLYYKENISTDVICYDKIYSSFNDGDYTKPLV